MTPLIGTFSAGAARRFGRGLGKSLSPIPIVDYLIVAGGGGGGRNVGGGGGGGGVLEAYSGSLFQIGITYNVAVGAGGARAIYGDPQIGSLGGTSSIHNIIASGGGGAHNGGFNQGDGQPGGCGGGAAAYGGTQFVGGSGTVGQGYRGGSATASADQFAAAGGGGAGEAAPNITSNEHLHMVSEEMEFKHPLAVRQNTMPVADQADIQHQM